MHYYILVQIPTSSYSCIEYEHSQNSPVPTIAGRILFKIYQIQIYGTLVLVLILYS